MYHGILTCPSILPICGHTIRRPRPSARGSAPEEKYHQQHHHTNTSTIRAQAPSFRYMQICAGGGYFSGRLARGFGASSCDVSEGNVRQWRSKHQVRPSGTCSFALVGGGYFFWTLGKGSEPVFARFRRQRQAVEAANQAPGLSFSNSCSWGMGACTHHDEHETAYRSHHCDDAPHGQFWQCSSWCRYRMGMCIRRWTLPRLGHWGAKSSNGGRHGAECATDT